MGLFGRRQPTAAQPAPADAPSRPSAQLNVDDGAELLRRISRVLESPRPSAEDDAMRRSQENVVVEPQAVAAEPTAQAPLEAPRPVIEGEIHVSDSQFASEPSAATTGHHDDLDVADPASPLPTVTEPASLQPTSTTDSATNPDPTVTQSPPLTPSTSNRTGIHRISVYLNPFASRSSAKLAKSAGNTDTAPAPVIAEQTEPEDLTGLPTNVPITDTSASSPPPPVPTIPEPNTQEPLHRRLSKKTKKQHTPSSVSSKPIIPSRSTSKSLAAPSKVANAIQALLFGVPSPVSRAKALKAQKKVVPELMREDKARLAIEEVRGLELYGGDDPNGLDGAENNALGLGLKSDLAVPKRRVVPAAVRAVCLDGTDEEIAAEFITELGGVLLSHDEDAGEALRATVGGDLLTLRRLATKLHLVDLLRSPPLDPASDPLFTTEPIGSSSHTPLPFPSAAPAALLAGALPSPQAVLDGVNDLATTLLALGLGDPAALLGKPVNSGYNSPGTAAIPRLDEFLPDHKGVYPPKDRMSVITYWWGYELVLPEASVKYLSKVKSIEGIVLNFLTFFAMLNGGVREIMPFVRYIAQYVDIEWAEIRAKDKGQGVVCAATWLMPIALVARAWDFEDPPPPPPAPSAPSPPASAPQPEGPQAPDALPDMPRPPALVADAPPSNAKTSAPEHGLAKDVPNGQPSVHGIVGFGRMGEGPGSPVSIPAQLPVEL